MLSRTRPPSVTVDGSRAARAHRRDRIRRLLLSLCGSLAALTAIAPVAQAEIITPCGSSLAHVKAFHGHAYTIFSATASGEDPGEGGSEAISLNHRTLGLKLDLNREDIAKGAVFFHGTAKGGGVAIEDVFGNSGTGFAATESYADPLTGHLPNFGNATLGFDRRKGKCRYDLELDFGVRTAFSGDEEIQPDADVSGGASSGAQTIPDSLKLSSSGDEVVPALLDCRPYPTSACYDFGGGWTTDFATLKQCGSVVAAKCTDSPEMGEAQFGWNLSPTFNKQH